MDLSPTLGDIGERRLISEHLTPRYSGSSKSFGDDCARVLEPEHLAGPVVATTDPCPIPVASYLGFDDFYYWGWLLGVINLSDIAAAGATPRSLLASYVLPNSMPLSHFIRLMDGLDECCAENGARVVGGNLKEGSEISLSATAFGTCVGEPVSRHGARPGDMVMILGDIGLFWAGFLAVQGDLSCLTDHRPELLKNVLKPSPKVSVGKALAASQLLSSAVDNSDGLQPSLEALCKASDVGIKLDFSSTVFSSAVMAVANEAGVDPVRLALGWGDWQLVTTAPQANVSQVVETCQSLGVPTHCIGEVVDGDGITLSRGNECGTLLRLDSERFAPDSWFTAGLPSYVNRFLYEPLIEAS